MRLAPWLARFAPLATLSLASLSLACGGGSVTAETSSPAEATVEESAAFPSMPPQPHRAGTIARGDLMTVLEAGLGRFLGGVGTEPELESGRFVGWRITRLYPDDPRFADIALRPGDVVTRVNAQPIERPEQAFQVWDGLRVASELVVDFRHDGEAQQMRYAIVD